MSGTKPRIRVPAGSIRHNTGDGFANFLTDMGIGTNNVSSASTYAFHGLTRNRMRLDWMYRGAWLSRKIIDCPANDMTRAGIDIEATTPPDDIKALETAWRNLQLWDKLRDTIKWARLYGGAMAVIMIDGEDPATPLDITRVAKGAFKGLLVLDRWMIQPSYGELIGELGPEFGYPKYYNTISAQEVPPMTVHHSRCIRFEGDPLPYWQRIAENGWGASVMEALYDRMVAFDSATTGAAQLVYKAHLRTYKVKDLRELIANGGNGPNSLYAAFLEQMRAIRLYQSSEGLTVIDGEDELDYHSPGAFSGLSDALTQFGQQLSGACGIPLVILFGQSPSGFSTGETDVLNYYDRISSAQHSDLEEPVRKLLNVLHWSLFGRAPVAGFGFSFNSLWQQTEGQKADTAGKVTSAVVSAHDAQIISTQTALKELKQSSRETGIFSNITDEEIAAADDTAPNAEEMMAQQAALGGNGGEEAGFPTMPEDKPVAPKPEFKPPAAARKPNWQPPGETETDDEGMHVVRGTGHPVVRIDPKVMDKVKINRNG